MTSMKWSERSPEYRARQRRRRKSCKGKRRYPTMEYAEAVAHGILVTRGEVVQAYQCEFGDHYHVGHHMRDPKGKQ